MIGSLSSSFDLLCVYRISYKIMKCKNYLKIFLFFCVLILQQLLQLLRMPHFSRVSPFCDSICVSAEFCFASAFLCKYRHLATDR